jgi:hypothetical protein
MFSYFNKFVGSEKKETVSENFNNIEFVNNNNYIFNTNTSYGLDSDSESEYDKIFIEKQSKLIDVNNDISSKLSDPKEITNLNDQYKKIYGELIDTDKLVRKHVSVDFNTVEKIKENCYEYIGGDVQIIKEFALVMETFENIKIKIKNFESDIGDRLEIDNKMNQINLKLENTIETINKIKFDTDEYMRKIIHLENLIKIYDEHRNEILSRLEKFNKEHVEIKKNNFQILNSQQYFLFAKSNYLDYLKYLGIGLGICSCVIFGLKIFKKN